MIEARRLLKALIQGNDSLPFPLPNLNAFLNSNLTSVRLIQLLNPTWVRIHPDPAWIKLDNIS